MLNSILSSQTTAASIQIGEFLICILVSLILGGCIAAVHLFQNQASKSFILTLVLIPVMVQTVITIVNGNLGTGVAVMGAFSLVRFRSLPGTAREISSIFLAMAVGLATGMGFIGIAVLLFLFVAAVTILLFVLPMNRTTDDMKALHITIPENMDYNGIFDDIFSNYTTKSKLLKVKTVNMGSLFELHYEIVLKDPSNEKQFIDEIRCRNGNLNITCGRVVVGREEL